MVRSPLSNCCQDFSYCVVTTDALCRFSVFRLPRCYFSVHHPAHTCPPHLGTMAPLPQERPGTRLGAFTPPSHVLRGCLVGHCHPLGSARLTTVSEG